MFELDQRVSNADGTNADIREDRLARIRILGHLIREATSILETEHVTEINSLCEPYPIISVRQNVSASLHSRLLLPEMIDGALLLGCTTINHPRARPESARTLFAIV